MLANAGHHWAIQLGLWPQSLDFLNTIHLNTLIMTWAGMALILLFAFLFTRKLALYPSNFQVVGESIFDLCRSITTSTGGKKGDTFLFYIGSLFVFILVANLMGQLPLRLIPLPQGELIAATGDFNVPAALAVFTVMMYFYFGIKKKGLSYFKHYIQPFPVFLPFNILEDFTRPFSLMLRLYANILVGELLAGIMLGAAPYVAPSMVNCLELFVAIIQAYIFAVLSSVYIALLSAEDH